MGKSPIEEYCAKIINGSGGLHAFERHELAGAKRDRDEAVAIWTIKCLANPRSEGSARILELIQERRKELSDA